VNGAKNLIMGLWVRQSFRALEKFIASLRHTTFAGDVCLCVEDISADTVAQLRAHGIIVVRTGPSAQPRMTALASRYFTFLDFLTRHANDYVKVMLTDPAAVVFQSDPFAAPLPADIVYTSERRLLCKSPAEHGAVVQAYGESVAHNIRDCMVSNTSATIGTFAGILRYVVAMTHELSGRTTPISGLIDQGVHNYVVHMHPQRGAWLDPAGSIAVAMDAMPDEAVRIAEQGVLIDGRLAPVLCRWDGNSKAREHVKSAPRFRLDPSMRGAWPSAEPTDVPTPPALSSGDAVVAYYQRQRDADWLQLFLGSLRCVRDATIVHCVGDFDDDELAVLARYGCTGHQISASESGIAENLAHFYLNQVLEKLTADRSALPDQVLVLDNMSAVFLRDPFLTSTIGLSVFSEGPTRIADSDYNRHRLAFFVPPEESQIQLPIVSSALLRGRLPVVCDFYRQLFAELVGRPELLSIQKVVQGAVNKLCHSGKLGFPVIIHPNAAEVVFDFWPFAMAVDTRHGVRIGGAVPAVVLGSNPQSVLMRKLRVDLSLSDIGTQK
jgi:hypothetical protein